MRLRCEEARALFAEELEGSLDELRSKALAEHVSGCVACRAEKAELAPLYSLLRAESPDGLAGVPDPGGEYWSRFAGRVRTRRAGHSAPAVKEGYRRFPWLSQTRLVFGGAVAFAASVVLLVILYRPAGSAFDIDDTTLAMFFAPHLDPFDPVRDLSSEEVDQVEEDLLAAGSARKGSPTPNPSFTGAPRSATGPGGSAGRGKSETDGIEEGGGRGSVDLDDLSPEEMDQLLQQLDAKKT